MRLDALSPATFALGLGALSLALYLLQRLRVRQRELSVVTTLFWREAVDEARARVLVQRFRHPLAYLLALLLAGLLWLAAASPRADSRGARDHLVLVDGSAWSTPAARLEACTAVLPALVERLPRDAREVRWCGDRTRTLLAPGEPAALLTDRLADLEPTPSAPGVERELAAAAAARRGGRPLVAIVVGDVALDAAALALLPPGVEVTRAAPPAGSPPSASAAPALRALGASEARSGRWDAVDVLVELEGAEPDALAMTLDGAPVEVPRETRALGTGRAQFVLRDLPARGGVFEARLSGAAAVARLALPDRPPIRVLLSSSLEDALGALLSADPAVLRVEPGAAADVVLRRAGESVGGDAPALELVDEARQEEALLLLHPATDDSHAVLENALAELGLSRADAQQVADQSGRPFAIGAAPADRRGAGLWSLLLEPEAGLVGSRGFPPLVAGLVRWLAGAEPLVPFAVAGEALDLGQGAWSDGSGAALDPLGAAFVPPRAGTWTDGRGRRLEVSLLRRPIADAATLDAAEELSPARGIDLLAWVGALALALLLVEWALARRGSIP